MLSKIGEDDGGMKMRYIPRAVTRTVSGVLAPTAPGC